MNNAFIFPGQGSQTIGMLSDYLTGHEGVKETFEAASSILNEDLLSISQQGPESLLNRTDITQPLILTASVALWQLWLARGGEKPQIVAGHSLGEYSALVASGVLQFEDAVKLVNLRGQLMQQAVPEGQGAMAAVLGLQDAEVVECCAQAAQGDVVSAVNFNAPGQVVIAGSKEAVERAVAQCKESGAKRAILLPVSVPSHCDLMRPAAASLAEAMEEISFNAPEISIVQNVNAREVQDVSALKANLLAQLYSPVQWTQSVRHMIELGANRFIECGPGKVLTGLTKRIDRQAESLAFANVSVMDELLGA